MKKNGSCVLAYIINITGLNARQLVSHYVFRSVLPSLRNTVSARSRGCLVLEVWVVDRLSTFRANSYRCEACRSVFAVLAASYMKAGEKKLNVIFMTGLLSLT